MRIKIAKQNTWMWVKEERLDRFLGMGWTLVDEPAPKKNSRKVKVDAVAEVVEPAPQIEEEEVIPYSMPKDDQDKGDE